MPEWLTMGLVGGAIMALTLWLGPRGYPFLRAVTSGWNKDNVAGRLAICKECPRVKQREYVDHQGDMTTFLYCDECKCGSHHLAELNTKLGFNNLKCPIGKWGASGMTVHEGHDLLVARAQKEHAIDKRERENIMAGRDRDYVGPLTGEQGGHVRAGDPAWMAGYQEMQKEQSAERETVGTSKVKVAKGAAANAGVAVAREIPEYEFQGNFVKADRGGPAGDQRTTVLNAAAQAQLKPTKDLQEQRQQVVLSKIDAAKKRREELMAKAAQSFEKKAGSREAQVQRGQIWAQEMGDHSAPTAPTAGTGHEGQILVDQEKSDGGQALDERGSG